MRLPPTFCSQGFRLKDNEGVEDDEYTAARKASMMRDSGSGDTFRGKKANAMKDFMEAQQGAAPKNKSRGKFMSHSSIPLQFVAQWNDGVETEKYVGRRRSLLSSTPSFLLPSAARRRCVCADARFSSLPVVGTHHVSLMPGAHH